MDLSNSRSISSMETLVQLLRERVGSPISYKSLAEDIQYAPKTIKHWMNILENLYIVFKVLPWHKNIKRSLVKAPKYYFYDIAQVKDFSARLENLAACAFLKNIHFHEDIKGESRGLFYLRDKDKREVDFLITKEDKPFSMIEVKTSQTNISRGLNVFSKTFPNIQKVQLVKNLKREKTFPNGIEIRSLSSWLAKLPIGS